MKNVFAALALCFALLVPPVAFGATTWTTDDTVTGFQGTASKAACTTGTESAPTLVTQGFDLRKVRGFVVHAEASGAMTAGGKLLAHVWNPYSARWNPVPDLDLTVAAVQYQSFAGFSVTSDTGRIAYVPSGVGVAVTIYVVGK